MQNKSIKKGTGIENPKIKHCKNTFRRKNA